MTRRQFLLSVAATPFVLKEGWAFGQETFQGKNVFAGLMDVAKQKEWHKLPMGQLVGELGYSMIGTPYLGHTLELYDDREVCAINLAGVDCATFYEAALAMARVVKIGRITEGELVKQVTLIRYRSGKLRGYASRLHYASDYFYDNERKGITKTITSDLPGAALFTHKVGYMSQNPSKYRQLAANPSLVAEIAATEAKINARRTFFLPKAKVEATEQILKSGDILGLTTTVEGLDCSHTGLCYRDADEILRFLHASSVENKVILGPQLSLFLSGAKINDGIMVSRPLEL